MCAPVEPSTQLWSRSNGMQSSRSLLCLKSAVVTVRPSSPVTFSRRVYEKPWLSNVRPHDGTGEVFSLSSPRYPAHECPRDTQSIASGCTVRTGICFPDLFPPPSSTPASSSTHRQVAPMSSPRYVQPVLQSQGAALESCPELSRSMSWSTSLQTSLSIIATAVLGSSTVHLPTTPGKVSARGEDARLVVRERRTSHGVTASDNDGQEICGKLSKRAEAVIDSFKVASGRKKAQDKVIMRERMAEVAAARAKRSADVKADAKADATTDISMYTEVTIKAKAKAKATAQVKPKAARDVKARSSSKARAECITSRESEAPEAEASNGETEGKLVKFRVLTHVKPKTPKMPKMPKTKKHIFTISSNVEAKESSPADGNACSEVSEALQLDTNSQRQDLLAGATGVGTSIVAKDTLMVPPVMKDITAFDISPKAHAEDEACTQAVGFATDVPDVMLTNRGAQIQLTGMIMEASEFKFDLDEKVDPHTLVADVAVATIAEEVAFAPSPIEVVILSESMPSKKEMVTQDEADQQQCRQQLQIQQEMQTVMPLHPRHVLPGHNVVVGDLMPHNSEPLTSFSSSSSPQLALSDSRDNGPSHSLSSQSLPALLETPREAAVRRRREAADREMERIVEATAMMSPSQHRRRPSRLSDCLDHSPPPSAACVPWALDDGSLANQGLTPSKSRNSMARNSIEAVSSPSDSEPRCDSKEPMDSPRAGLGRRKREAAQLVVLRLKEPQMETSKEALRIGLEVRESHARAFLVPFATAHDCQERSMATERSRSKLSITLIEEEPGSFGDECTLGIEELPGHSVLTPCKDSELGSLSTFVAFRNSEGFADEENRFPGAPTRQARVKPAPLRRNLWGGPGETVILDVEEVLLA